MASPTPAFRLLGFPVHVRPGFLLFAVLIVAINGPQYGVPFALMIAVLTLIHELGHALAARRTGAEAEIALDFMAGYASFTPRRPLRPLERIGISLAGPAAQIVTGTLFYVAIGGRSVIPTHGELTPLQAAAFWAGPVIGLLNLIPVLPLDGGNMLHAALSAIAPSKATRWMYAITVAITGAGLVWMILDERARPYIVFVLLPLFAVFSSMGRDKQRARQAVGQQAVARAEATAWATGRAGEFPPGARPSPWFRAWEELQSGRPDMASRLLLADLADPSPSNWWPPDAAPVGALRDLAELLPAEMTAARSFSAYALGEVLLRTGDTHRAGTFAATAYGQHRTPLLALQVARAAAALGDQPTSMAWLRTAARGADPVALRQAVDRAPEFEWLRHDPALADALTG